MTLRPFLDVGSITHAATLPFVLALTLAVGLGLGAAACDRGEARPDSRSESVSAAAGAPLDSVAAELEAEMAKFPERFAEEPFPLVAVGDVAELLERGAEVLLVDAREAESYARGHLPGAVNFPYGNWLEEGKPLPPTDRDLIVYCNSQDCPIARLWSEQAAQRGYTRVRHMKAGFAGWQEAGLPLEEGAPRP